MVAAVLGTLVVASGLAYGALAYLEHRRTELFKTDVKTFLAFEKEWESAESVARRTPRFALATQVAELQRIRREWDGVKFELQCSQEAKPLHLEAMTGTIESFLEFMENKVTGSYMISYTTRMEGRFYARLIACDPRKEVKAGWSNKEETVGRSP
jgi:hypothetical protein